MPCFVTLKSGGKKYLLLLSAALALHYLTKETSFIYTAQALLFLAIYFIAQVTRRPWKDAEKDYRSFIIALGIAVLFAGLTVGYGLYIRDTATLTGTETAMPSDPDAMGESPLAQPGAGSISPTLIVLALAVLMALVFAAVFLIRGYTWEKIRNERSFDLLMVCGTIVLPMLSPFPVNWLKSWLNVTIPTTAPEVHDNERRYPIHFDHCRIPGPHVRYLCRGWACSGTRKNGGRPRWSSGFPSPFFIQPSSQKAAASSQAQSAHSDTGSYNKKWQRGSQPWYFYVLIQIPIYEFLPALGLILAIILGLRRKPAPKVEEKMRMKSSVC